MADDLEKFLVGLTAGLLIGLLIPIATGRWVL